MIAVRFSSVGHILQGLLEPLQEVDEYHDGPAQMRRLNLGLHDGAFGHANNDQ